MPFRLIALMLALSLSGLGLTSCATMSPAPQAAVERPLVILVSIDGFRADYLARGETPVLARLAAEGATGPMQPAFPSKTFPNHYTIVTGLRPDHHGIVNNNMVDPTIPGVEFRLGNASAVTDRRWWDDGEPIWVTAEKAGLTSAAMFWPGSEADVHGVRPSLFAKFDQAMPGDARVDRLLSWLDLPKDGAKGGRRPDIATLYFDIVDTAGHNRGPDSPEVDAALASVDASMGHLLAGLEARGLRDKVVLIVVSDHGMAATSPQRVARLGPLASSADTASVLYTGPIASVEPLPGHEAEVAAEVLAPHDHMQCWRKADIPARFEFGTHRRVPSLFCLAEDGWEILKADATFRGQGGGDHGYDNAAPDMQAIFIANGVGVRRGVQITGLRNVDVHGLLGRLLGIAVPADDGNPAATAPVLSH
jgi:predicted AlkP superfamily pyrophosphatase or phosphodiesterase